MLCSIKRVSEMNHNRRMSLATMTPGKGSEMTRRKFRISQRRSLTQNIVYTIFWPIIFAIEDVFTFPHRRSYIGFILFCGFAGWTFIPQFGSDSYYYAALVNKLKTADDFGSLEPIIAILVRVVVLLYGDYHLYFMLVGFIYGTVVVCCARLLFRGVPINLPMNIASQVFMLAFLLNYLVFDALNSRYYFGMWVLLLATILMTKGRIQLAFFVASLGTMVHYGHSIFLFALVILFFSRGFGKAQIVFAYILLLVAFSMPSSTLISLGEIVSHNSSGTFNEKVGHTVRNANQAQLMMETGPDNSSWFIQLYQRPIFISLMISGHLLWWKIRKHQTASQYQLFVLIIIMWALCFALSGDQDAAVRIEANTLALLLLWHACWFLYRKHKNTFALYINAIPMALYLVVTLRRSLDGASLAVLLPTIFIWFERVMPTIPNFFLKFHF